MGGGGTAGPERDPPSFAFAADGHQFTVAQQPAAGSRHAAGNHDTESPTFAESLAFFAARLTQPVPTPGPLAMPWAAAPTSPGPAAALRT